MAVASLSQISAALNLIFADDIADALRRDIVLLSLLAVESDRNETCTWSARLARADTAKIDDGSDVAAADIGTSERERAFLSWARYSNAFGVDGLAASVAAANSGNRLGMTIATDLLAEEAVQSVYDLALFMAGHLYDGVAGSNQIVGVDAMATGNTYAGIDNTAISVATEWTTPTNTIAAANLDHDTLRDSLMRPFKNATGRLPDFLTCDGETFDRIGHFFGSDRQYVVDIRTPGVGPVNLQLAGGFNAIVFDGVPVIEDRFATANKIYAWDARPQHGSTIRQMPKYTAGLAAIPEMQVGVAALTGTSVTPDAVQARVIEQVDASNDRLQPVVYGLAKNGDSDRGQVVCYAQMRTASRKCHAQLTLTV